MKRGMNKKAQAGIESKTINWIIAFMVLLAVGLGIYFFMEKAGTIGTNIPGAEEAIAQGCAMAASSGLQQTYCTQLRQLANDKYITCDKAKENGITIDSALVDSLNSACSGMEEERKIKILRECSQGDFKGDKKVMINGKTCAGWGKGVTCKSLKGDWRLEKVDLCEIESFDVIDESDKPGENYLCYVPDPTC